MRLPAARAALAAAALAGSHAWDPFAASQLLAQGHGNASLSGVLAEEQVRLLSCAAQPQWADFLRLLARAVEGGGKLAELHGAAEELLAPWDEVPREYLQGQVAEFHAQLSGASGEQGADGFCFPGYQAACFVRVLSLEEAARLAGHREDGQAMRNAVEESAQNCASMFGQEAYMDFLSSTGWPVSVLDFEVHMRYCLYSSFTSRLAPSLPDGVETYADMVRHVRQPGPQARLFAGAVDPQRIARTCGIRPAEQPPRKVVVASVDGGHCSLWLEPASTLRRLFPGVVSTRLASFKDNRDCLDIFGPDMFASEELLLNERYFEGSPALRTSDVLVCQWVGECVKLRAAYTKPVIAYVGFLPLNDPSVGNSHAWSEPLAHYWERFETLLGCDVHGRGRGRRGAVGRPPLDGGPPCALVFGAVLDVPKSKEALLESCCPFTTGA